MYLCMSLLYYTNGKGSFELRGYCSVSPVAFRIQRLCIVRGKDTELSVHVWLQLFLSFPHSRVFLLIIIGNTHAHNYA